jgi:tetratricopeptide (TPR) repeat protein
MSEAEEYNKKAIEWDKRHNMMWYLAYDYAVYAELFQRKGDLPKAKERMNKALLSSDDSIPSPLTHLKFLKIVSLTNQRSIF